MSHPLLHRAALLCAIGLAATGCASSTPELDRRFGHSMRAMSALQTLHPTAPPDPGPVAGLDGKAAVSAYDSYLKSYKLPEPQSTSFIIGVGSH